ncbi:MAG: hypothetical protein HZA14_07330 [Nitrospirae bacterium]|nr:hypothetical protein [Nitrospirota bacterium]
MARTPSPFVEKYRKALKEAFPAIKIIVGTHQVKTTPQEYRDKIKKLFCQDRKTMVDVILKKD